MAYPETAREKRRESIELLVLEAVVDWLGCRSVGKNLADTQALGDDLSTAEKDGIVVTSQ